MSDSGNGEPLAVLVLDGAMGTRLGELGHPLVRPLWSAEPLLTAPQVVREVHRQYIAAGADILTTNTFRTNLRTFVAAGLGELEARRATELAVRLAQEAVERSGGRSIRIAGSIAPVCDCYHPEMVPGFAELLSEHRLLAVWLAESGVDLALIETMNTMREAVAAAQAAREAGLEVWVSFLCGSQEDRLLSGERLDEAVQAVVGEGATAVGVNCLPVELGAPCLRRIGSITDRPMLVYANGGKVESDGRWRVDESLTPARYGEYCRLWIQAGARFIGGCCGTGPAHIQAVRNTVDNRTGRA